GERSDRSLASPLFRLEAEILRLLGQESKARRVVQRGIESSARAGASSAQRELLVELALIDETFMSFERALAGIQAAKTVPGDDREPIETLRLLVISIRLLRKLGKNREVQWAETIERTRLLLTMQTRDALDRRPALLCEVVAELGTVSTGVLTRGLELL